MTPQEAKQVLLAYRPWADDAQDPEVAEALALCQRDAELKAWFENLCATQTAIRDHFRSVPVPDGLRQQILSEHQSHTSATSRHRRTILTAAAITVLLAAIISIWFNLPRTPYQNASFTAYRNRMVREVVKTYAMDLETNDAAQIRAYLVQQQAPADFVLPKNLEQTQTVGCGALNWQGQRVTMVCFRTGNPLPPGTKSDLFLFVIDQKNLSDPPQTDLPIFANVSTMATATWRLDGKIYLLAAPDASELKQRL